MQFSGMLKEVTAIFLIGLLAWAYQASHPPPPCTCGSPGCPPITAPRIKLRDGRHLAYKEHGVSKQIAKYKIIFIHGLDLCMHDEVIVSRSSTEVIEELGVYVVSFDRPGYGESDPDPKRTAMSFALDVEELADQLGLGSKFYVIGYSMGGQLLWDCLKYIPHRLAGATLMAPAVNYWWPGFPSNLSKEAFNGLLPQDQWALRVAHYTPCLTYWWNTQRWFPPFAITAKNIGVLSRQDVEIVSTFPKENLHQAYVRQQGDFESIHRDLKIGWAKPEYDPLDLENPFPNNEVPSGDPGCRDGVNQPLLEVKDLTAVIAESKQEILKRVNLVVYEGEVHAIMGKNGSGKSTFSKVLVGHPDYEVTGGSVLFKGENLLDLDPEERPLSGLFMSFQSPVEIPGVSNIDFLNMAYNAQKRKLGLPELGPIEFFGYLQPKLELVNMKGDFLNRNVNEGFSGGEKKRNEILQLAVLGADLTILDEIDSGLDVDALKDVANAVNKLLTPKNSLSMITHYLRLLEFIKPTWVHIMEDGSIKKAGDISLAKALEKEGYRAIADY
ncbi:ABC transporter I family member 6 chloroplastic [Tripterygium wilfordii]|uniref:ABC transporter I family member 6 chloroplastic n=1 Tax=Tripterygium wilfordii TaxID=458696 RepID=A0A7J7CI05_TRIWF|nr:ABC transporter I family member 6 chloroplastic [Tripterygium wilfordii]